MEIINYLLIYLHTLNKLEIENLFNFFVFRIIDINTMHKHSFLTTYLKEYWQLIYLIP